MFEPTNEQGVIVLFVQQAEKAGIEIIEIQTGFPDAIIQFGEMTYRAEFEFKASNFIAHGHDVRDCDILICWKNDLSDFILPVLELSKQDWFNNFTIDVPSDIEKSLVYWKGRALVAESKLDGMSDIVQSLETDLELTGYIPERRAKGKTVNKLFCLDDSRDKDVLDYLQNSTNASQMIRDALRLAMAENGVTLQMLLRELREIKHSITDV